MKKYNVAVVGATGLVGQTFLKVIKPGDMKFYHQIGSTSFHIFILSK